MYTYNTLDKAIQQLIFVYKNNDRTLSKNGYNKLLKAIDTITKNKVVKYYDTYFFVDEFNLLA
tara:strand:- start:40 stop:228 length:189 start_codon:yes stop_codon:yes gene_type:complete